MAGGPVPEVTGHRYEFILNQSVDSITLINSDHVYELVNDSYCKAIGKSRDAILGHSVADIWGDQRYETEISPYLSRCLSGETVSYIQRFKFGTEKRYMQVTFYPYEQDGNGITHALVFSRHLTRLGELENRIVHYESRDPHTGLFNRKSLEMLLDMEILKAQKDPKNQLRGLLFIGIENLTDINRNLGHDIGDYLIENTGLRIRESIRNGDFVFQFQHDELVVILSYLAKASDAALVAEKLIHAIGAPYRYQDNDIALSCRIGVALYPDDADDQHSLVRHAIAALNEAVRTKSPYKLYDAGMHAIAAERFSMEAHLRQALEDSQFELFFQPIVAAGGGIEGVEALVIRPQAVRFQGRQAAQVRLRHQTGLDEVRREQPLRALVGAGVEAVVEERRPHRMEGGVIEVRDALAMDAGAAVGGEAPQLVEQEAQLVSGAGQVVGFGHRVIPSLAIASSRVRSIGLRGRAESSSAGRRGASSSQPI